MAVVGHLSIWEDFRRQHESKHQVTSRFSEEYSGRYVHHARDLERCDIHALVAIVSGAPSLLRSGEKQLVQVQAVVELTRTNQIPNI